MVFPKQINLNENHKVLVFLHYFGGSAKSWKWVIDELQDDYHCIAISFPGFGNSIPLREPSIENFAEYIQKELASSGVTNYILVGHSMGAKIALQIAANDFKGNIQQLILIAPSPPGIEPMAEDEKHRMINHPDTQEAKKTIANITRSSLNET